VSYDTVEASVESSQPREYGVITHGNVTYRFSLAARDLVVSGVVYPVIAGMRSEQSPAGVGKQSEMKLTMPIDHALCRRYTQNGVPPKVVTCTLYRQQSDLSTEQLWTGNILSMAVNDECTEASFNIRSRAASALLRVLPTVTAGRMCPYVWGDTLCGVDPNGTGPTALPHKVTTTVTAINGRVVRVNLSTIPAADDLREGWATNGYFKDVTSGEIMTILDHTDPSPGVSTLADLTLEAIIAGLAVGSSVEVFAGCPREIVTCSAKFANKQRYGGEPQLPTENPMAPQSYGVPE
jgi:hypothetical protein